MDMSRGLKATDKRDRVFALVGISSDAGANLIDYERDFANTLRLIARKEIEKALTSSSPSDIFDYMSMVYNSDSSENLSSWAPTFDYSIAFCPLSAIFKMNSPLKTAPQVTSTDS